LRMGDRLEPRGCSHFDSVPHPERVGQVGSLAAGMPVAILHQTEGAHTFTEHGSVMGQAKRRGNTPGGEPGSPRPRVSDLPTGAGRRGRAGFILVLAAAIGIQLIDINRPFIDRHDWATAHQSQLARNHLRYGLAMTKTRCMYTEFVENRPDARRIYPDHPPLLPLVLALNMAVFGASEIAVRSVAGAFTVASIGLTMSLARGLLGRSVSLLAGLALLPMPILVYFGHIPSHETVALPFALLALRGYFGWLLPEQFQRQPGRDAALLVVGTVLMILVPRPECLILVGILGAVALVKGEEGGIGGVSQTPFVTMFWEMVPQEKRGRWFGIEGLMNVATIPASLLGGFLWQQGLRIEVMVIPIILELLVVMPLLASIPDTLTHA